MYPVIECVRLDGGFGLGVMLSFDGFLGVSVCLGWWSINVGFRRGLL